MPIGFGGGNKGRSGLPPPSELTATNVGTSGGTGTISGLNFVSGCSAFAVIGGVATALTITFNSSTNLSFVLPAGSYTAGTWNLTVTNPDGQFDVQPIFVVSASSSPATLFGAALKGWWIVGTGTLSGGAAATNGSLVDTIQDQSGNGFHLTASGSARPTYNATASFCPSGLSYPSVTCDGVANLLLAGMPGLDASTDLTIFIVFKSLATNTNKVYTMFGANTGGSDQRWAISDQSGTSVVWLSSAGASGALLPEMSGVQIYYGGMHGTSGSYTTNLSINNGPASNGTSAQTWSAFTTRHYSVGGASDASSFANLEFVEAFVVAGHNPTSSEYKAAVSYLNFKYINRSPTFSAATTMYQTGTGFRVQGGSFVNGASVTLESAVGVQPTATTYVSSTVLEVAMPGTSITPGSYDITISNPDGGAITQSTGFTVTGTRALTPMTVTGDLSCVGWFDGSSWTLNGSAVSGLIDQSLLGNTLLQATSANQPAITLADADFAGKNSWTLNGTTSFMATTGNLSYGPTFGTAPSSGIGAALTMACVVKVDSSNPTGALLSWWDVSVGLLTSAGRPQTSYGGGKATWATAVGGTVKHVLGTIPLQASTTISVDVNNSGTPAVSGTLSPSSTAHALSMGAFASATFGKGKVGAIALFNRALTTTEQANLRTWASGYGA